VAADFRSDVPMSVSSVCATSSTTLVGVFIGREANLSRLAGQIGGARDVTLRKSLRKIQSEQLSLPISNYRSLEACQRRAEQRGKTLLKIRSRSSERACVRRGEKKSRENAKKQIALIDWNKVFRSFAPISGGKIFFLREKREANAKNMDQEIKCDFSGL
jgi:hypothetical protein